MRLAHNHHRCRRNDTTFLYVGSDIDAAPLMHLKCHETNIIFVEPLTWFGNYERVEAMKKRMEHAAKSSKDGRERVPLSVLQQNFDRLFECNFPVQKSDILPEFKDCIPNITSTLVHSFARRLASALSKLPLCSDAALESDAVSPRFVVNSVRASRRRVSIDMHDSSKGGDGGRSSALLPSAVSRRRRKLNVLISTIEDVDLQAALHGDDGTFRPISTVCNVGVGMAAIAAQQRLCAARSSERSSQRSSERSSWAKQLTTPTLRLIHRMEGSINELDCGHNRPCLWNCYGKQTLRNSSTSAGWPWSCPRGTEMWKAARLDRDLAVSTLVDRKEKRSEAAIRRSRSR